MELETNRLFIRPFHIINKNSGRRTLRSSIWQNKQGKWKMVFHQGTVTKWDPEQLNSLLT